LLGTEDALFFPSGTQANQTGIALLTRPGTELLLEANAHLVHYEMAGLAALWGVQIKGIATPDGLLTPELVRAAVRPPSPHVPRSTALAVENTHNAAGGRVLGPEAFDLVVQAARAAGLGVHFGSDTPSKLPAGKEAEDFVQLGYNDTLPPTNTRSEQSTCHTAQRGANAWPARRIGQLIDNSRFIC